MATILIIEDNPYHRRLMVRLLEKAGYHVVLATNGEEAIQKVQEMRPDLITMDMGLPDLDGQTVISLLRDAPGLENIPIVAVTAWPPEVASRMAAAYGCEGYVYKPIKAREFAEKIAEILARRIE